MESVLKSRFRIAKQIWVKTGQPKFKKTSWLQSKKHLHPAITTEEYCLLHQGGKARTVLDSASEAIQVTDTTQAHL